MPPVKLAFLDQDEHAAATQIYIALLAQRLIAYLAKLAYSA